MLHAVGVMVALMLVGNVVVGDGAGILFCWAVLTYLSWGVARLTVFLDGEGNGS